jgi:hypothetical protein
MADQPKDREANTTLTTPGSAPQRPKTPDTFHLKTREIIPHEMKAFQWRTGLGEYGPVIKRSDGFHYVCTDVLESDDPLTPTYKRINDGDWVCLVNMKHGEEDIQFLDIKNDNEVSIMYESVDDGLEAEQPPQ